MYILYVSLIILSFLKEYVLKLELLDVYNLGKNAVFQDDWRSPDFDPRTVKYNPEMVSILRMGICFLVSVDVYIWTITCTLWSEVYK